MPKKKHLDTFIETIGLSAIENGEMQTKIYKFVSIKFLKKGEILLQENTPCNHLFFLIKGLFRSFYVDLNGQEITSAFSFEKEFFTNVKGFINNINSNETLQALENSIVCVIDKSDYFNLINEFPSLLQLSHLTINKHRVELEDRIRVLQHAIAADKLLFFDQYYTGLINRVPKKYIASFLGMRYETMYRALKKRNDQFYIN
jgi:CRP-like cAMP-binding protein